MLRGMLRKLTDGLLLLIVFLVGTCGWVGWLACMAILAPCFLIFFLWDLASPPRPEDWEGREKRVKVEPWAS